MKSRTTHRGSAVTLRTRFLAQNLLLVLGLTAAGVVVVWRLGVIRGEVDLSRNVYAELRTVGDVGVHVGIARGLLAQSQPDREAVVAQLQPAVSGLNQFITIGQGGYGTQLDRQAREAYVPINAAAASARERLEAVLNRYTTPPPPPGTAADTLANDSRNDVDVAMSYLDQVAGSCIRFIGDRQRTASADLNASLWLAGALSALGVVAAVGLSALQYRLVMAPLLRLREGVLRVANAQFTQSLETSRMGGSAEFLDLAREFNRMAGELDEFYRRLEEQVRAKSRELVRSERLASVGFLAAGVAHEINNPLHIISGYAELTARHLEAAAGGPRGTRAGEEARRNLRMIREEAFRCKQITERLLDLARGGGGEDREPLDLVGVARDVADMTRALTRYRDRRLTLRMNGDEPLEVRANRAEMKQVLLNLTINALDSVPPEKGEVWIEGRRGTQWVELSVADNGRGMTPEVLQHVFEPFFTARPRQAAPNGTDVRAGTGLGLSITHAIIERHGGRIVAESGGPGRGARFTVRLPVGPGNGARTNSEPPRAAAVASPRQPGPGKAETRAQP